MAAVRTQGLPIGLARCDAWRDLNPGRLSEGTNSTQRAGYELTNPGNILR